MPLDVDPNALASGEGGLPGGPEYGSQMLDLLRQLANKTASTAYAHTIAPDEQIGPHTYGIGMVENAAGLGSAVTQIGADLASLIPGVPRYEVPKSITDFADHLQTTQDKIAHQISDYTGGILPVADKSTPIGYAADLLGGATGMGVGVIPGGPLTKIARPLSEAIHAVSPVTSSVVNKTAHFLVPTVEGMKTNVPVATVLGTALSGGADAIDAATGDGTPSTDSAQAATIQPAAPATTPAQPFSVTDHANTTTAAPAFSISDSVSPPTDTGEGGTFDVTDAAHAGTDTNGITFSQQGVTPATIGKDLLTLGVIAVAHKAGRYTAELHSKIGQTEAEARFADPDYAKAKQAYENDVVARGNSVTPPQGMPVPPPLPTGNAINRAVVGGTAAIANDAAPMQAYFDATAPNPSTALRLSSTYGNYIDPGMQNNLKTAFLTSGIDPNTGVAMPSPIKLLQDKAGLEPDKLKTSIDGLVSANELNDRKYNLDQWQAANPGADPATAPLTAIRRNLFGFDDTALQANVDKMMADPELADIKTRYKGITDGLLENGNHSVYGFFPDAEVARMKAVHPDYVPSVDIDGQTAHPFGPRDLSISSGAAQATYDPFTALAQHTEQMFTQFQQNAKNRMIRDHQAWVQKTYPTSAQFMQDVAAPEGAHLSYYPKEGIPGGTGGADPIVAIRTPTGVKYTRFDDPMHYNAVTNNSLSRTAVNMDSAAIAARWLKAGTTGLGSIMTGRAISPMTAARTLITTPVNAPHALNTGIGDILEKKLTGGRVLGIGRGTDMLTNLPVALAGEGLDLGNHAARRFAAMLDPAANNPINKTLRAIVTDPVVNAMQQAAQNRWNRSSTKQIQDMHMQGAAHAMMFDNPGVRPGTNAGPFPNRKVGMSLLSAGIAPEAFFDGQWMGAKPFTLRAANAVKELMNYVGDAGQRHAMRMNLNNDAMDTQSKIYATRALYGNPFRHGGSPFVRGLADKLPYLNVAAQEAGSTLGAVARSPFTTATTMATGLGGLAALSILTHMRSPQHMDYFQNQLATDDRIGNVVLALNDDPNSPTEIPLPRMLHAPYAFIQEATAHALNLLAARHDPVTFNNVWEGIKDFLGSHISEQGVQGMKRGLTDVTSVGTDLPLIGHLDQNELMQGRRVADSFHPTWEVPEDRRLQGQDYPSWFDTPTGEMLRSVLSNTFGGAAASLYDGIAGTARYHNQGNPFFDSLGMAHHDWLQTAKQDNPMFNNMLYDVQLRQSLRPPIADKVAPSLYALEHLPKEPGQATDETVGKGAFNRPVPQLAPSPVSSDMQMKDMFHATVQYKQLIDKSMQDVNAVKAQMGAVQKMGMNPVERTKWLNDQTRVMADKYKLVDKYITDMNAMLSRLSGKPMRLQDVDWTKDHTQFTN